MAKYICGSCANEQEARNVSIRILDGEARADVRCDKCNEYMKLKNPKSGIPSFKSNRWGRVL